MVWSFAPPSLSSLSRRRRATTHGYFSASVLLILATSSSLLPWMEEGTAKRPSVVVEACLSCWLLSAVVGARNSRQGTSAKSRPFGAFQSRGFLSRKKPVDEPQTEANRISSFSLQRNELQERLQKHMIPRKRNSLSITNNSGAVSEANKVSSSLSMRTTKATRLYGSRGLVEEQNYENEEDEEEEEEEEKGNDDLTSVPSDKDETWTAAEKMAQLEKALGLDKAGGTALEDRKEDENAASASMVAALRFYKSWISPLLPPACRFVPTCSQYGVQAIQEFGPLRGAILIAWRLLRCSPLGGRGYDPPKWPPVPFHYASY